MSMNFHPKTNSSSDNFILDASNGWEQKIVIPSNLGKSQFKLTDNS